VVHRCACRGSQRAGEDRRWCLQQLAASGVPVLAFSGDADPAGPAPNMAGAPQFWLDSRDVALPGQGHALTSGSWFCEDASQAS
jgi:pimeloyl-ACP methyl ester carboxylesterase